MRYFLIFFLSLVSLLWSQTATRTEFRTPDIPEVYVLKCDFHTHTVFSDGQVWPSFRIEEAWKNGLDAIALTDHLEYAPHKDDLVHDLNRVYEIGEYSARGYGLIVIRGAEITRDMPPGHLNAIFLKDANALKKETWREAVKEAADQGAFIFWNHPGWEKQQPDGIARWYDEHTEMLEKGWMHGIEVVNDKSYYPNVLEWCNEKNLAFIGNSDIHSTVHIRYVEDGHRPLTLVFAKERSKAGIKQALHAGHSVAYFRDDLIGPDKWLYALFEHSLTRHFDWLSPEKKHGRLMVTNNSDFVYHLEFENAEQLGLPEKYTVPGNSTVLLRVKKPKDVDNVKVSGSVNNLKTSPTTGLPFSWTIDDQGKME